MAIDQNQIGATPFGADLPGAYASSPGEEISPLVGVAIMLVPDEVEVVLQPESGQAGLGRLQSLWHHVEPRNGVWISLTSLDSRPRIVRLSVRSDALRWNGRWVRFTYAVRVAPEALGGEAINAQDVLADDESALTLLLLPGETREATLELIPMLDGETLPGDYAFDVVLTDVQDGSCESSPGQLHIRHPAARLLDNLPAIYTESMSRARSKSVGYSELPFFLRFLRGFEDAMQPTQELIDNLDHFFGPNTAPPDFLPWLATWVALVLDENWSQLKRRRLIREAVELYRWRGTRRGLARYLEIYAGVRPEINDQPFMGMKLGKSTLLGQDTMVGNVPPHTFVVTLAVPDPDEVNEQIVRDIIESEKPAHTAYSLRIVRRAAGHDVKELSHESSHDSYHDQSKTRP